VVTLVSWVNHQLSMSKISLIILNYFPVRNVRIEEQLVLILYFITSICLFVS
jgi:hypothetical protein